MPAAIAMLAAVRGVVAIERRNVGVAGVTAALLAVVGLLLDAVGGSFVGWAGGVQGIRRGGLYHLGHDVQSIASLTLPSLVALGLVVAWRGRHLSRTAGLLPLLSVPVAAVIGVVIGATGGDGGMAAIVVLGSVGLQYVVWGTAAVRRGGKVAGVG